MSDGPADRYHLSEATGERRFMVVRFTPLGAHLFLRLSMDALADRTVGLEQIDPGPYGSPWPWPQLTGYAGFWHPAG